MQTEEKEEIFQGYLTEEEKQEMFNKGKEEGIKKGKEEGIKEGKEKIVKNLIKQGYPPKKIAKATTMSITEIATLSTTII